MSIPGNDLTPAEQKLIEAAREGVEAFYGDSPQEERVLRGAVVSALAAGWREDWEVHPRGIRARDAHIEGCIDLTGAEVKQTISLERCQFNDAFVLTDASTRTVSLRGSKLRLFVAQRTAIHGLLDLSAIKTSGPIILSDARVGGSLELRGARLTGQAAVALDAFSDSN